MPSRATIVWFRHDLRLGDNLPLTAAVALGGPIIPVFIWAPAEEAEWTPGAASQWWLHQSLQRLDADLQKIGSRLIIRRGESLAVLQQLLNETNAATVYWNRRYEPAAIARDAHIKSTLRAGGVNAESFNALLLFEPWTIRTKTGTPYRVFTPFWRACLEQPEPAEPTPAPVKLTSPAKWPASLALSELQLEPTIPWDGGMRQAWSPGNAGAMAECRRFLKEGLADYTTDRERPDHVGSSRLSPFLHWGEISPRYVWHAVKKQLHKTKSSPAEVAADPYLRQLVWREFAYHLLFHYPTTPLQPLREEFALFPWGEDRTALRAWQHGKTGYPLVDAGMRQLWTTGWMHNRVRMVVGSFLVKHLLLSWQSGAKWFWDTLVDADLANNTLGWQWIAGCGADAAPYFRIFNPVTQGEKCDPRGDYVRQWVPELADLPAEWIQHPWEAPQHVLEKAGVELGKTYPLPIVDHQQARKRALAALAHIKK